MSRDPTPHPRITVSFQPEEYAELRRLADLQDRSLSWLVRHAVEQFLRDAEARPVKKAERGS